MDLQSNPARGAGEWDAVYGKLGATAPVQQTNLPLTLLDPWTDNTGRPQPFKPYTGKQLRKMADSIRENGIIEPICVRPLDSGRFQIISGHNRARAAEIAGLTTVPVLIRILDEVAARRLLIDSNLHHRPVILPSERARSYSEIMADIAHQGRRQPTSDNDCPKLPGADDTLTSDNDCPKLSEGTRSDQVIADMYGVSATSVKQYIHLLKLHPAMLDMVDNEARNKDDRDSTIMCMAFVAGYELSFLSDSEQELVLSALYTVGKAPTPAQAKKLRQKAKEQPLDEDTILAILQPVKSPKTETIKLPAERISSFFPPNTAVEEMEAQIYAALLAYQTNNTPASA